MAFEAALKGRYILLARGSSERGVCQSQSTQIKNLRKSDRIGRNSSDRANEDGVAEEHGALDIGTALHTLLFRIPLAGLFFDQGTSSPRRSC
jgi:hypothetical protein